MKYDPASARGVELFSGWFPLAPVNCWGRGY